MGLDKVELVAFASKTMCDGCRHTRITLGIREQSTPNTYIQIVLSESLVEADDSWQKPMISYNLSVPPLLISALTATL